MVPKPHQYHTIVIGLGIAGTTAATALAKAGRRVLALEAMDRVGGRVNTVPFGEGVVELGAEWVHGKQNNQVNKLATEHNLSLVPQIAKKYIEIYRSDGSLPDEEIQIYGNELVEYTFEVASEHTKDPIPLGQHLMEKICAYIMEKKPEFLKDKDFSQYIQFLNLVQNNYHGSNDWNDPTTWSKYQALEGEQLLSWHKYGYRTIYDILLNKHNNGPGLPTLDIKLGTEVTAVRWPRDERYVTVTAGGNDYCADNVIVTVSLGVLKERHATLFSPPLPQEKVKAIQVISMGVMDKIILSFKEAWWPKSAVFFGFVWRGDDLQKLKSDDYWTTRIFGASSPMGSKNVITMWTSGEVAKLVETLPEDTVKRKCTDLLRKFLGVRCQVPEPTGIVRSTWYSNPYTRGSYSFDGAAAARHLDARQILAAPLTSDSGVPRVLFAGEHTHENHFSTVHGAFETGRREASRILPGSSKL